jgi:hypothetical protein
MRLLPLIHCTLVGGHGRARTARGFRLIARWRETAHRAPALGCAPPDPIALRSSGRCVITALPNRVVRRASAREAQSGLARRGSSALARRRRCEPGAGPDAKAPPCQARRLQGLLPPRDKSAGASRSCRLRARWALRFAARADRIGQDCAGGAGRIAPAARAALPRRGSLGQEAGKGRCDGNDAVVGLAQGPWRPSAAKGARTRAPLAQAFFRGSFPRGWSQCMSAP